jgi:uncharacterized protein
LTSRHEQELIRLQKELKSFVPVSYFTADLTKENDLQGLLAKLSERSPDLIINNAGFGLYGDILTYTLEEQMDILQVNACALTRISIESARNMIRNKMKGTILNISSAAGFFYYPSFTLYCSSKAYVTQFSLSFDAEVRPYGVRVLVCCPGQINTPFRAKASQNKDVKTSHWDTMSVEKAAALIWKQIEQQKNYQVIDLKYGLACFLARFLIPKNFLAHLLKRQLACRFNPRNLNL